MMNRVYLLLGSNMGNKEQMLNDAVEMLIEQLLPDYLEVEDLSEAVNTSSVYETEPWGFECNSKFLNQAFMCLTDKSAEEVLDVCLGIEVELGRERKEPAVNEKGVNTLTWPGLTMSGREALCSSPGPGSPRVTLFLVPPPSVQTAVDCGGGSGRKET